MSQAGYTPIQLYYSTTAAAAPSAGNLANGELAVNITDGKLFYKDNGGVVRVLATAAGSAGDVVGPGSSTDNALVRFDGTTGKLVQSSVGVLSDAGVLTGLTGLTSSGSITFSGLTSGRVTYAGTGGLLQDSANLTFDGTTLTANALTVSNAVTLSGGTANGVAYLNGSKVLTTGSALTFDGTNLGVSGQVASGSVFQVNAAGGGILNNVTGFLFLQSPAASGNGFIFRDTAAGSYAEYMRLTSVGLGIGTSSPAYKLDVNGQARLGGSTGLVFGVGTAFAGGQAEVYSTSTTPMGLGTTGAAVLRIYTNSTLQATIDSSGNLGLGVTPQARLNVQYADSAPTASGTISSGVVFQYAAGGVALNMGSSSGGYVYFNSAFANNAAVGQAYRFYQGATQAMTLDGSGNLQLGTTTNKTTVFTGNGTGMTIGAALAPTIACWDTSDAGYVASMTQIGADMFLTNTANGVMVFNTNNTERARIDSSGNLLVGTTSNPDNNRINVKQSAANSTIGVYAGTGGGLLNWYKNDNTYLASVTFSGSTVTYGTGSDYRLKNITGPITNSGAYIDSLNPVEGTWKADGSTFVGLIAHEVQEASRTTVATGVKDGEKMQGMDYSSSEIIANMIAELKSLRARVAQLESN